MVGLVVLTDARVLAGDAARCDGDGCEAAKAGAAVATTAIGADHATPRVTVRLEIRVPPDCECAGVFLESIVTPPDYMVKSHHRPRRTDKGNGVSPAPLVGWTSPDRRPGHVSATDFAVPPPLDVRLRRNLPECCVNTRFAISGAPARAAVRGHFAPRQEGQPARPSRRWSRRTSRSGRVRRCGPARRAGRVRRPPRPAGTAGDPTSTRATRTPRLPTTRPCRRPRRGRPRRRRRTGDADVSPTRRPEHGPPPRSGPRRTAAHETRQELPRQAARRRVGDVQEQRHHAGSRRLEPGAGQPPGAHGPHDPVAGGAGVGGHQDDVDAGVERTGRGLAGG